MPRRTWRRRGGGVLGLMAVTALVTGCATTSRPDLASLRNEPILRLQAGATEMHRVAVAPRSSALGRTARDGVVEVVSASPQPVEDVAAAYMAAFAAQYGLRRIDSGHGTPVTVELRGQAPGGRHTAVLVVLATLRPETVYAGPADLPPPPPDAQTFISASATASP